MTSHYQIGTDKMSSVGHSPGSVMSSLHPAIVIPLTHGEGLAASCSSAVVVTITETPTSEAPDVSTPVVNIVLNASWSKLIDDFTNFLRGCYFLKNISQNL